MFYVYILKCNDGSFYTGYTDNLAKRLVQHSQAHFKNCYTVGRLPVRLAFQGAFKTKERALIIEKQINEWSKKQKQALIDDNWSEIMRLSRKEK